MDPLSKLCAVRDRVFDASQRDTVLDLTDLIEERINAHRFFETNYVTDGMRTLLREAFDRFSRRSDQGIFLLTQSMGGGKTHNMIALGLLAQHPDLRQNILNDAYDPHLGRVRVAAFTGRESDAPYGIWGSIAAQLGKKEQFSEYYSPLQAPGQTAWVELLKGDPLLILLDELPPYFENARAQVIGNADLATVTNTALSNLFVAAGRPDLANVCIVVSDLKATYSEGSQQVGQALNNLQNEASRSAMQLEPVRQNTNEIYHILRKQLFKEMPAEDAVRAVAQAYASAVKDAKQMAVTDASPETFARRIQEAYPFHFSIRDLYARFRENPGFQQTRDLIRLMRTVVAHMYKSGAADERYLIHPYDIDLNHDPTLTQVTRINAKLENAVSHDIASGGSAVAETIDENRGGSDAKDMSTLLLIASLPNVPKSVKGLTRAELISFLCTPDRNVAQLREQVLKPFVSSAWYLHTDAEGRLLFKDVKNITAELNTTAEAYGRETRLVELRTFLKGLFEPEIKDVYQAVQAMPAVDEISVRADRVTLVLARPSSQGLNEDLQRFYADQEYKNRLAFLTGQKTSHEHLLTAAARLKAIRHILEQMKIDRVSESDPQYALALEIEDDIKLKLLSAARETFTTLYYPSMTGDLRKAEFIMQWTSNNYNGEEQIRDTLTSKGKFTTDVESDTFRKKCEDRLFTQKQMLWTEVKKRAAAYPKWPWHRADALERLKERMVHEDQWREEGNYINKGPFPPPRTDVRVQEVHRDHESGEVTLRLTPVHGDTIYYEVGAQATTASRRVTNPQSFKTTDLKLSFLCVDSADEHETGEPVEWINEVTIQHRIVAGANGTKKVELKAVPQAGILYTTDGSNPNVAGGRYEGEFEIDEDTTVIQAVVAQEDVVAEPRTIRVDWDKTHDHEIDDERAARWALEKQYGTTSEVYETLKRLKKLDVQVTGAVINVADGQEWVDLSFDQSMELEADKLEASVEFIRGLMNEGEVSLRVQHLHFTSGANLKEWAHETNTEVNPAKVDQS